MAISAIIVNGERQQIDYNGLANKPTIPDLSELTERVTTLESNSAIPSGSFLPSVTSEDQGKVLTVNSSGEWQPESLDPLPTVTSADQGKVLMVNSYGQWQSESLDIDDLSSICEALRSEINSLKARVYILEHGDGSTASSSSISGDKLSLTGTNTVVNGEKLSVTGSGFTVNGEKLSITEEV